MFSLALLDNEMLCAADLESCSVRSVNCKFSHLCMIGRPLPLPTHYLPPPTPLSPSFELLDANCFACTNFYYFPSLSFSSLFLSLPLLSLPLPHLSSVPYTPGPLSYPVRPLISVMCLQVTYASSDCTHHC